MLKSSLLDRETHDLVKNKNTFSMIYDKEAIKQRIWIRLGINKGEWFLNTELGVPWYELLDNNATLEQIRAEVYNAILEEEYVKSIDYVSIERIDRGQRILYISFSVLLTTGDTITSSGEVNI